MLVALADKLDNARAIERDLTRDGVTVFRRFTPVREDLHAGIAEVLWYDDAMAELLLLRCPSPLAMDLAACILRIRQRTPRTPGAPPDASATK